MYLFQSFSILFINTKKWNDDDLRCLKVVYICPTKIIALPL